MILTPEEKNLVLTPRWFKINPKAREHIVQQTLKRDLYNRAFTYYCIVAGRRSYKTERFGKRFPVDVVLRHNDLIFLLGAPTRQQAKEIFWDDIKQLINPIYIKSISESELKIKIKGTKSEIQVIGLKEFRRKEGLRANAFVISEFQQCDPKAFTQTLQPMINDTRGFGIFEGRPFGKNHLFEYFNRGMNKLPGWTSYLWKSAEILTDEQIIEAKRDLAERDYDREYNASFETEGGSPYYSYSQATIYNQGQRHYQINYMNPFIVTCDFNATVKPMSWVVGQKFYQDRITNTIWLKTLSHQFTHTEMMCKVLHEYFQSLEYYPQEIHFYGDYAGDSPTSNSSLTDWSIILAFFQRIAPQSVGLQRQIIVRKFIKPTRSIRMSIGSTNAQLLNTLQQRRQWISTYQDNKALVDDWQFCTWKDNKMELNDKDDLRGHACRAVDYYNDYDFPVEGEGSSKIIGRG